MSGYGAFDNVEDFMHDRAMSHQGYWWDGMDIDEDEDEE